MWWRGSGRHASWATSPVTAGHPVPHLQLENDLQCHRKGPVTFSIGCMFKELMYTRKEWTSWVNLQLSEIVFTEYLLRVQSEPVLMARPSLKASAFDCYGDQVSVVKELWEETPS